jgi:hypothetical protein
VRNASAAGCVTLARGKRSETLSITQVSPEESAPVLKEYLAIEPITRRYFDAGPDSPLQAFVAEASRRPVFLLLRRFACSLARQFPSLRETAYPLAFTPCAGLLPHVRLGIRNQE